MTSGSEEVGIPFDAVQKWQRIVDLLADIMHVPSAVVCKLEPPDYQQYKILASSTSEKNPFPVDDTFAMDIGTFCETVIKSREPLLVTNALEDDRFKQAPEIKVGMISYLGLPVVWPDGRMFGTICVLDDKANPYSDAYQQLLSHCRDVLQADLHTLVHLSGELEDQKLHLNELFARVPDALVMLGRDLRIMRVNPGFTKVFGHKPEDALGRRFDKLLAPVRAREAGDILLHRMFEADEAFAVETDFTHQDGTLVPVSAICIPVPSGDGRHVGYLICRDMTETKRFQEEQRRYQEIQLELAHLNRIAGLAQLSASIAHELNQPLTGIIANCGTCLQMMTNELPDLDGAREAVRRTMRDGNRASEVVERLRALFSNKEPVFTAVDLNEAVREMIALSLSDLQDARVTLRTELASDLPPVSADRVQIQQVILNLVRNALDAMQTVKGRPRELLIKSVQLQNDQVQLSVTDAGVGFYPETMAKLFDAFYTTKDAGMGVGLAVSRSIVEKHHGQLWASPNQGPGATFSFTVPIRNRQELAAPAPDKEGV